MDYRQLNSFVVLAEELHFGKAALRLNITQPALSQHVKALEKALQIPLFTRDRRHVALTYEGQQLVEEARIAINHRDKFLEGARALRQGFKGQLKLGYVGSSILDPALTLLINGYCKTKPDIDIVIEEHNVHDQLTLLLNNQLDIALVRSPVPYYPELDYLDIACRPLIAVLPGNHPLGCGQKISLAALSDCPFLIQKDPPGVGLGWSVINACQQAGFVPRKIQFTRDVSVAIGLVSMGMGVTLVPETQSSLMIPDVTYCFLSESNVTTTLTFSWQKHSKNKALIDFIRLVMKFCRKTGVSI
ncbi:LysR family transcriptional regulator [Rouxiella badensis]|uniref:LysR family transcriptional regulator n=1 Tax=Rahnella perminowiae TaxID=2816244 RepID=A0ABS6KVK2_9GAMM|nr:MULTISPECIES: LysR substrate-binding domain-containing protein [Yersiniaceae]MBU9810779.1 LysR family transcriptional regulator [Rahnella perminowiae]MBU9833515.1 LysR family transcriptional regulator [Rahnella perminowiae]MBU9849184.1 LysR family transcriptional regulator [Rahnella aceris]MBU9860193.1 LysR family transcriptional regulator [Rahnella aceris]MBU9865034.1 LysR family transcriptional regulator [Rahnella aceris]